MRFSLLRLLALLPLAACGAGGMNARGSGTVSLLANAVDAISEIAYVAEAFNALAETGPANQLVNPPPPPGSQPAGPVLFFVPDTDGTPRPVDTTRMCDVLRKHASEFAPYWQTARSSAKARSTALPRDQFQPVCASVPLETRRCLFEPYRQNNLAVCTALLTNGDSETKALLDTLYLEPTHAR